MLYDNEQEVRKNAVIALYNLEGRDVLIKIISDETLSPDCAQEAQDVLLEIDEEEDE